MAEVYTGAGTKIAKLPGLQPVLPSTAESIKVKAEANAGAHRRTGKYSSAFEVKSVPGKKGVRDRLVENTHPASAIIEYGHFAEKKDGSLGEWVPGQFNLTRAVNGG